MRRIGIPAECLPTVYVLISRSVGYDMLTPGGQHKGGATSSPSLGLSVVKKGNEFITIGGGNAMLMSSRPFVRVVK